MEDLSLFYTDETQTEIKDRPSDFLFHDAVEAISVDFSQFDAYAEKHHLTKLWQWFDSYRFWKIKGEVGTMYTAPTLDQVKTELNNHFRSMFKATRQQQVDNIKVTVDGMVFDGDEVSRARMVTAIVAANDDVETVNWALADNTVAAVTRVQLKEALRLSGEEMASIWFQS